jgi:hypothetical protein
VGLASGGGQGAGGGRGRDAGGGVLEAVVSEERVFIVLAFIVMALGMYRVHEQQARINALIELNHNKSLYIDAGCRGRYQGTEEMLPGENALGGAK